MGTKIRLTALILAASLTMNMVIMPVKAEDIAAPIEQLESEPVESIAAQTESSEPTSPTTESSEPTSPTTESSEPTSPTTESSEPTSPTTESSEPGAGEESSDLPEQLLTPEEEETLLEETGESMLFSTLTRATDDISEQLKALAEETAAPLPAGQIIEIRSGAELYFLANSVKPEIYQNCVLKFTNSQDGFDVSGYADFPGLGTAACPFNGTIAFADGSKTEFILKKPLFQCLYDSAQMPELILHYAEESSNTPVALFAQEVRHNGEGSAQWSFTLQGDLSEADVICTPPLIGSIEEGSSVSLGLTDLINLPVETAGNAGLLCGTLNGSLTLTSLSKREPISVNAADAAGGLVGEMGANGSLTVNLNQVTENDTSKPATLKIEDVSATGNAGGLVGKMVAGATLTINTDVEISGSVTASGGDAGGLVGLAEYIADSLSTVTIKAVTDENNKIASKVTLSATAAITGSGNGGGLIGSAKDIIFAGGLPTITGTGSISGANAGGLIGRYTYSGSDATDVLSEVSQNISGIKVNGSGNAGGVFGVLNNTSSNATFNISANTVSTTLATGADAGHAGGLIGQYSAANLDAALVLSPTQVTANLTSSASAFGGLIGRVSGGPAYLELSGAVELKGTAKNYGGLIGSLTDSGHMVVVNDATITKKDNGTIKGTEKAGGLIGWQPHGVLKLAGKSTVTTPECDKKDCLGNILGCRDNTLVYSTSQWTPMDGGKNDIGNWGQVLCANQLSELLDESEISTSHTVTVIAPDSASIGTVVDFAKVAMQFQLSSKDALSVEASTVDLTKITLTGTIDLSGTGLTGFQRDYSSATVVNNVTLTGDNHTIILPGIKTYTYSGAHDYQGLFSKVTNLTAENLTISGSGSYTEGETTISNVGIQLECNGNFYVGALAANASGNITLTSVTAGASIITNNGGDASIGGLVGKRSFANEEAGELTCSSCSWTSTIRVSGNSSGIYVGGLVGRVDNEGKSGVGMDMSFTNCTISGTLSRTGKPDDARIGGMLGACYGRLKNNDTDPLCFNLLIDGVKVNGATVTSDAKNEMGGLLSLEWLDTNVTVKNVVVKNSTVSSTYTSSFGGLVFKAMGYCKIESTTTTEENGNTTTIPGVTIESGIFSGPSPAGAPSALLICHGEERGDLKNALYLEILDGAYQIESSGITLDLKGSTTFDEIIGTTFGSEGKGNGIVSIATPGDLIYKETDGVKSRNTYGNQLGTNYTNSRTRYYYNLDSFGAVYNPPSGDINSPEKMVMFSAYSHADDSIKGYFYLNPGNITNPTGDIIDLTGYSYYPAEQYATVKNATIKFDFENIETREEGNKEPSDATRQHAGMHTGIFTGVSGQGGTLNVTGLILQGTVGGAGSNYGALIRDGASGMNANHMLTLNIGPVTLDGIRVIGVSDVKPLLINKLDSYTKLDISGVTTTEKYTDKTQKAASSLIGDVGNSTSGRDIQLTFSKMELNGKESESIFSHATFLESFQYANAGCSGVYNFEKPATGTPYTLGKELSNTGGEGSSVSGRNNGRQYWFYNSDQTDENLVCGKKEDDSGYNDPATFYATGYLRYVYQAEGSQENYHEIDINLKAVELAGCGTYSDPYIIKDDDAVTLLKQFADAITNKGASTLSMPIWMDPNVLGKTFKDEGKKTDNTHTCVKYKYEGGSWKLIEGSTDKIPTDPEVLNYLCNAYYKIDGEITISDAEWAGLGTRDNPFSGVIVGAHSAKVTISNTGSQTQYGGLIKFSQGSVVKDLTIVYDCEAKVSPYTTNSTNNVPSSTSDASFFGGVVGWCLGGDTIIDTVEVTYTTDGVTINGTTNPHLTAVGGYVGMVGGGGPTVQYGGGVVFRNMTAGSALTGDKASESSNYFYYNPYVGRVLDGYVMLEKPSDGESYVTSLNNTDKNYTIPTISAGTHLSIANGTVSVNNAQGLWLLSAIANSGAGAMQNSNCLAYYVGKPRTGTYAKVGVAMPDVDKADEGLLGGVGGNRTTCYLSKYVSGSFSNLCSSDVSIVLNSDCDMSDYGNGFRGIGTSYGFNSADNTDYRLIKLKGVDGTKESTDRYKITLRQKRREYLEEKDSWTSIGAGLIVQFRGCGSANQTVCKNLILSGSTGVSYYQSGNSIGEVTDGMNSDSTYAIDTSRIGRVSVGALIANPAIRNDAQLLVENVTVTEMTVNSGDLNIRGSRNAGGLIGTICYYQADGKAAASGAVTLQDCTCSDLTVSGRDNVGGFIGYAQASTVNIRFSKNTELSNVNVNSTTSTKTKWNVYGFGGLIGFNDKAALTIAPIDGNQAARLMINGLTIQGNTAGEAETGAAGGIVGLWNTGTNTATVKNVSLEGIVNIAGSNNNTSKCMAGGLAGAFADEIKNNSWTSANNGSVTIESVWFAQNKNSVMQVYNGRPIGGLVGYLRLKATTTASVGFKDIRMGSDDGTVRIANNSNSDQWHAAGGLIGSNAGISNNAKITYQDIQMINTTVLVHRFNHNDFRGGGVLFAFLENTETIDLQNVTLDSCRVIANNKDTRVGLLYSWLSGNETLCGTNILIKDCVVGYSNNTNDCKTDGKTCPTAPQEIQYTNNEKMGILGGDSGSKTVKLVGVSIQQQENTLPMKDFGTNPSSYYVVRADYKGYQDGNGENITGAKAPYVTTSPLSPLGTLGSDRITGDGASFVKDTTTPVGDQILADLKTTTDSAGAKIQPTNLNLKHSTALAYGESKKTAYTYLLENSGKAFFGDFKQQGGNSEEDYKGGSFPVLTLVTNSSVDANKLIYSWISLLTNRTINTSSEGVTITPKRYKWSGNAWGIDTTQEHDLPLQWDSTKKEFTLKKGVYDSGQNRFTLLDVAFDDPADNTKDAYHLYIPVIVQKMLRFRFWASAQTGTTYIKSSYMQQDALAAASHGQQVTVLMGFEYKRTQAEWQEAVNNGDNLLFGFEKTIQLESTSLPDGTRLTLVDCANQNKVYYADDSAIMRVQGSETKYQLSFANFTDAIYADGELTAEQLAKAKWKPVYLCDMLNLSVTGNSGQYYKLGQGADTSNATVRIANGNGYDYYQYKAAEDEAPSTDGPYSITVGWKESDKEPRLKEQYYLTIQTPETPPEGYEICNNEITCPSSLNRAELLPTLRENNESGKKYTRNGNENRVLIGDFFTQNVEINADRSNPEMSTVNHVIQATLTSEIKFSSLQSAEMYKAYAEGQNLFQSFDLRMQKTEKAGEQAQRTNLVPGTRITAAYFLGDTPVGMKTYTIARSTPSFRLDFPAGVDVGNWDAQNGATFKAELTLEYPDAAILAQFPLINGDPGNLGVKLSTSSYLAYTQEALPTTTIHDDAGWDANNFYRRDFKAASLNYYPVKRTENSTTESVNQLGVNGWNQQNGPINSAATYDASALDGAGNAKTLRCTLSLKRKTADGGYEAVDGWEKYLAEGSVPTVSVYYNTSGVKAAVASSTLSGNDYTTQFELADYEKDVPIEIRVDMNVLTGAGFEAEGKALTYANYKVEMCVELLDSTGKNVIAGSRAEDYIVYTNARINPNPIRE